MSVDMVELEFESLVPVSQEKILYVLEWTMGAEEEGVAEAFAFVVMKRAGGLLLALPVGLPWPGRDFQAFWQRMEEKFPLVQI